MRKLLLRLGPAVNVCWDEVGPEEPFELLVLLSVLLYGLEQPTGLVLEALGLMLVAVLDGMLLGMAQEAAQALVPQVLRKALAVFQLVVTVMAVFVALEGFPAVALVADELVVALHFFFALVAQPLGLLVVYVVVASLVCATGEANLADVAERVVLAGALSHVVSEVSVVEVSQAVVALVFLIVDLVLGGHPGMLPLLLHLLLLLLRYLLLMLLLHRLLLSSPSSPSLSSPYSTSPSSSLSASSVSSLAPSISPSTYTSSSPSLASASSPSPSASTSSIISPRF